MNARRQKLVQTNIASAETAETAQAAQDAAAADLSLANSDVLVAQANIGDAKAQQQLQSATLDFHTLAAPYDAMVIARLHELGSALTAGQPCSRSSIRNRSGRSPLLTRARPATYASASRPIS